MTEAKMPDELGSLDVLGTSRILEQAAAISAAVALPEVSNARAGISSAASSNAPATHISPGREKITIQFVPLLLAEMRN